MKRKNFYKPVAYATPILFVIIVGIFSASYGDIDSWIAEELADGDTVLCEREHNGDYFFISRGGEGIKTGYRINVTSEEEFPLAHVISWSFRNENGEYVETDKPPEVVSSGYVRVERDTYAREVAIRHLYLDDTKELSVIVRLYKYTVTKGVQNVMTQEIDDKMDVVAKCRFLVR